MTDRRRLTKPGALRISHIGVDSQFMTFVSEMFEKVAPGSNEYLVESLDHHDTLRFPIHSDRVEVVPLGVRGLARVRSRVRSSDIVIVHSMGLHGAFGIASARAGTLRVWSGWGGDYYGSDASRDSGLLGTSTLPLAASLTSRVERATATTKGVIRGLIRKHAARRTDYFSAPIPEDFDVFIRRFPMFRGGYSQLSYASVEDTFALNECQITGDDILVGNSSSFANNHLEIFEILADKDLSGRRIVVPLSYGDSRRYGQAVIERGQRLFGSKFAPILDFLPIDEYLSIVANCNVVVMGHRRQQALGNLGAALYNGAHVFLDSTNPTLGFFRSRGASVHTTGELESSELPHGPVSSFELDGNRRMLNGFWSREQVAANIANLINLRHVGLP